MISYSYRKTARKTANHQALRTALLAVWSACGVAACGTGQDVERCQIERRTASTTILRVSGDCATQDFSGVDLSQADVSGARWGQGATCPDGTRSGDNGGTCQGHLSPDAPRPDLGGDTDTSEPDAPDVPDDVDDADAPELHDDLDAPDLDLPEADLPPDDAAEDLGPEDMRDLDAPDDAPAPDASEDAPDACPRNACGGCEPLDAAPGDPCGACGSGAWACAGSALRCVDERPCAPPACASRRDCAEDDYCVEGFCTRLSEVFLPPGTYSLGAPDSDPHRQPDELRHQARLTRGVLFNTEELLQWEWYILVPDMGLEPTPCVEEPNLRVCPITALSWYDAIALANRYSEDDNQERCYYSADSGLPYTLEDALARRPVTWPRGLQCTGYRLPTEAEWEAAARADSDDPWPCGQNPECLEGFATFDQTSGGRLQNASTVGGHPRSISDILGNAWEWVWDWHGPYPDGLSVDPMGPAQGTQKIARGGCFRCPASDLRPARRLALDPTTRADDVGARIVRTWVSGPP